MEELWQFVEHQIHCICDDKDNNNNSNFKPTQTLTIQHHLLARTDFAAFWNFWSACLLYLLK